MPRAIRGTRGDFSKFALREPSYFGRFRTETLLVVKPERSRFDGFFVFVSQLVWIDQERCHAITFSVQFQQARVKPRRLALAKRVIEIEAHFHASALRLTRP